MRHSLRAITRTGAVALSVLLSTPALAGSADRNTDERIDKLLARMTLEEKLGQMSQSSAKPNEFPGKLKQQIQEGRWGSFLNAGTFEDKIAAQRIAVEESRLGIPLSSGGTSSTVIGPFSPFRLGSRLVGMSSSSRRQPVSPGARRPPWASTGRSHP